MKIFWEFLSPLRGMSHRILRILPFWIVGLFVLYLVSNVQIIPPQERALIFRFGQLVGKDTPQVIHEPGLLWAFPEPIDTVQRFPAQKIYNLEVHDLHVPQKKQGSFLAGKTLDPEKVGYILTADRNVLHMRFAIRYSIKDAPRYFLQHERPKDSLSMLSSSCVIASSAYRNIDEILTEGRLIWMKDIQNCTQRRSDEQELGIEIVSMEILDLQVPSGVRSDFQAVLSASVDAQTQEQEAKAYRAEKIPKAKMWAKNTVKEAQAYHIERVAQATSNVEELVQLLDSGTSHKILQERLYRERLSRIFSDLGSIRFIPPPKSGMRITISERP